MLTNVEMVSQRRRWTVRRQGWCLVLALVAAAGCDDAPTVTVDPVPARVIITPPSANLGAAGQTVQLVAAVLDASGNPIPNASVEWSSADSAVATVDATGLVTAAAAGTATITAQSGAVEGTARITVIDDPILAALVALYQATDGPNWIDNTNWLSGAPVSEWYGIGAEPGGAIWQLFLSRNGLKGSIPPELENLNSLENLSLSSNQLTGEIPAILGNLDRLVFLSLSDNQLTGEIPTTLGDLETLRILFLDRNQLTGPIPVEFANLATLQYVTLDGNRLSGTIPASLGNLEELRYLGLSYNNLSGEIPPELAALTKLWHLNLDGNELSGAIPPEVARLPSLAIFDVGDNQLTGPLPSGLSLSLDQLLLNGNDLAGLLPGELTELRLRLLDFAETELCAPGSSTFSEWLTGVDSVRARTCSASEHEALVLTELYHAMDGDGWTRRGGWLSDQPVGQWEGVDTDGAGRVTSIDLADNGVGGALPPELVNLVGVTTLDVSGNPALAGSFPPGFTELEFEVLDFSDTGLCAPLDHGFQSWLLALPDVNGHDCTNPEAITAAVPVVYLNQVIQNREGGVPLVPGRDALLRVFPVAEEGNYFDSEVRATFYQDGMEVHIAEMFIDGERGIGTEVDESRLEGSHHAVIPGEILIPGVEMVVELDPHEKLPLTGGSQRRVPETGRMALDVRELPKLELTLVPMLNQQNPDSSVIHATAGLTVASPLLKGTRTLLPVAHDMQLTVREPYVTSLTVGFESAYTLLPEIDLLRTTDGASGHYTGLMPENQGGLGYLPGWAVVASIESLVVAHELGHNMNLDHAPCDTGRFHDHDYPYGGGIIGQWGYDPEEGVLVAPTARDMMSYCTPPWISDYGFVKAMRHREAASADVGTVPVERRRTRVLILWGGTGSGTTYLEPAVVLDAPVSLPDADGPYRIQGHARDGRSLFSLSFAPLIESETGRGHFVFSLPVDPEWADSLTRITLTGPDGWATLDASTDRPIGIFTDRDTGRIRSIMRGSFALPDPAGGLDVTISRGLPDASALRGR